MTVFDVQQLPPELGRLAAENATLVAAARAVLNALDRGEFQLAVARVHDLHDVLRAHGEHEESGLFAPLRTDARYAATIRRMELDHHLVDSGLHAADWQGWDAVRHALDVLRDHLQREEEFLYPAVAQALADRGLTVDDDTILLAP